MKFLLSKGKMKLKEENYIRYRPKLAYIQMELYSCMCIYLSLYVCIHVFMYLNWIASMYKYYYVLLGVVERLLGLHKPYGVLVLHIIGLCMLRGGARLHEVR